jgi:hypothetical protein
MDALSNRQTEMTTRTMNEGGSKRPASLLAARSQDGDPFQFFDSLP